MSTKCFGTEAYGKVWIHDVMVDMDGTNLREGIDVFDEDGEFLCGLYGITTEEIATAKEIEELIDTYNEDFL